MNENDMTRAPNPVVLVRQQLDGMRDQFAAALPAHIPVERFARVVMTAVQNNPQLLQAPRKELWNAAMKAAQDGLLPDGREGAFVLRKTRGGGLSITWQPMIAGVRKKARNSGEISTWDAHVVYANDFFQFQLGDAPQINHSYDLKDDRGDPIGAYSVCVLKDGTKSYEVMSVGEINAIRDRSDGWKAYKGGYIKSTPWSSDWSEMARKTVAKRHSKVLPMSTDLDDLIRRDDDLYDFSGAKEEAQQQRPRSLAGRLDALAAPADGEPAADALVIEDKSEGKVDKGPAKGKAADLAQDDEPPPADDADDAAPIVDADDADDDSAAGQPARAASPPAPAGKVKDPAEWSHAECVAYGRKAFERGMARKAVVPPTLREEGQEDRAAAILKAFDAAKAEKEAA